MGRRDQQRLASVRAELGTVHLDGTCVMDSVLPAVRDVLQIDNVFLYSVGERFDGWHLTRWHEVGVGGCGDRMREALAKKDRPPLFHNHVLWPKPAHRNRAVDGAQWLGRNQPGAWETSRMCLEVLQPLGMHHHAQPRVLLCDGPALLAWFGGLCADTETDLQRRLLSTLVPAMRDRLRLERQLEIAPRTSAALRAAIEHLGTAAFILGAHGTIHETNVAGRALLTEDRAEITGALEDALAGRANAREIELVPLVERGVPGYFLAIVRHDPIEGRVASCVQHCVTRWGLTPRQAEVLALVARGLANATIAATMRVGERSIEQHMTAIFDRAGVDSRAALVATVLTSN